MPSPPLTPHASSLGPPLNVADRLAARAGENPAQVAVVSALGGRRYASCTFAELDADASALARGLIDLGVKPGTRIALLVKPGVEFVKLVFALLRSGATTILIDPGMGRKHLVNSLAAAQPEGFVAVSAAQALRTLLRRRFPRARLNVTVGRRWFWGGPTYNHLLAASSPVSRDAKSAKRSAPELPTTYAADPAAIIFTSGSTGPPKGVLYTHEMFDVQAAEIQRAYDLQPGGADLACFALFGLFNAATGVTTIFPQMDFSHPAKASPRKLLAAANDWKVNQAFASPTIWDKLSRHCETTGESIPSLRKVFSCGAPVRAEVILRTLDFVCPPDAEMHTPYGATEALPIATIEARAILGETAAKTADGAGVCVGRNFDSVEWRIIAITDEPIPSIDAARELPAGQIGELIVRGPQVSSAYVVTPPQPRALPGGNLPQPAASPPQSNPRPEAGAERANALAKISDGAMTWHRMGDVGYLDDRGRFWYCGRKSQRVETRNGPLFTESIEAVFNALPGVKRSALVGVGPVGDLAPVVIVEPVDQRLCEGGRAARKRREEAILHWEDIEPRLETLWDAPQGYVALHAILFHGSFPVDVRHNAKINREALAKWATERLAK